MPLEGVRDADAQGAEALTVALEGYFKGRRPVEEVTLEGELASVYVHLGADTAETR